MIPQVLEAVQDAFHTSNVTSRLRENEGRVFGSVTVEGSIEFDSLDGIRRQQRLWDALEKHLGVARAIKVGPIVLEPQ